MPFVALHFPVFGTTVPVDHGYDLYAAISRHVPKLHDRDVPIRIGPIPGTFAGKGLLRLEPRRSRLRLRLPTEEIPMALQLAGKGLNIGGHMVRVGVPQVTGLTPGPALIARLVTIKGFKEPEPFLEAVRRQLDKLQIHGEAGIPFITEGPRQGQLRRRILRVKDKGVVGYSLQVTELTAEESIRLQENGLGGRGKMGCGFFVPLQPRSS